MKHTHNTLHKTWSTLQLKSYITYWTKVRLTRAQHMIPHDTVRSSYALWAWVSIITHYLFKTKRTTIQINKQKFFWQALNPWRDDNTYIRYYYKLYDMYVVRTYYALHTYKYYYYRAYRYSVILLSTTSTSTKYY